MRSSKKREEEELRGEVMWTPLSNDGDLFQIGKRGRGMLLDTANLYEHSFGNNFFSNL